MAALWLQSVVRLAGMPEGDESARQLLAAMRQDVLDDEAGHDSEDTEWVWR